MSKFICIKNESGIFPRTYIEKMGISSKRDDPNTVGCFGSGSKLAPIAALRRGWRWVSCGEDREGPYQMEYIAEKSEEDGFQHIFYDYGTYRNSSSFTLDAGLLSWDDAFQIFREAFANALDEKIAKQAKYDVSIVDEIEHIPGYFCVYLTAADELMEYVENFNDWFCLNAIALDTNRYGTVFPWSNGESFVFQKGIRVGELENAIFSYEFNDLSLNEERRIKDIWELNSKIPKAISECTNPAIIEKMVSLMASGSCAEMPADRVFMSWNTQIDKDLWLKEWVRTYGENAILCEPVDIGRKLDIQARGYEPIMVLSEYWRGAMSYCGVQTAEEILGESVKWNIIDEPSLHTFFKQRAVEILGKSKMYKPNELDEVEEFITNSQTFTPPSTMEALGLWLRKDKKILMADSITDFLEYLATIVHELDHALTGFGDSDEHFRAVADDRIARLLAAFVVV